MKPSQWYEQDNFRTVEGHRQYVHDRGTGPLLLCLHGVPGASWTWHKLADELAGDFRVLAPDLLGFGRSDKPEDARYSIVAHSDRIESLLADLGETDFHILGQGMGAMVGVELLARAEGRLAENRDPRINPLSLYLVNAPLFPELSRPPRAENWLAGRLGEMLCYAGTRDLFARYLNELAGPYSRPTPTEINHLWQLIRHKQGRRLWPAHARYHRELMRRGKRWVRTVRDSERPIGLAAGPEDPIAGHRLEGSFRRTLPHRRRTMVGKLGHTPQLEAPDKLLPLIRSFHEELVRELS